MFYVDRDALRRDVITLTGAEARHAQVRRLRAGEHAQVSDGAGHVADCVVLSGVQLVVKARHEIPKPVPSLTVVQAIPKGDRADLAVEAMTEVGVDRIVPWTAERCIPVWRDDRGVIRWQAKARESAKQALRAWIPEVTAPVSTAGAARLVAGAASAALLDPGVGAPLAAHPVPAAGEIVVIIGPEGGITAAERDALASAGAAPCRLGPSVLRASTAGAVAAALLLSRTRRWR